MNKVKLRRYQAILSEQLTVLLDHNEGTVEQLEDDTQSHPDPNDRASAESGRSFDLRMRDRDRKLIGKIEKRIAEYCNRPASAALAGLVFMEVTVASDAVPGERLAAPPSHHSGRRVRGRLQLFCQM